MSDHLDVVSPGASFDFRIIPITGDRLIHPGDSHSQVARIVLRWGPHWLPQTWSTRKFFERCGVGGDEPRYTDAHVKGWLLLPPEPGSLADQVRSGRIDVAVALSAEATVWPSAKRPGTHD
jgi:hypothetical protein